MRWGRQRFAASLLSAMLISGCAAPIYPEDKPTTSNIEALETAPTVPTGSEIEDAFLRVALATSAAEKASIYSQYGLDRDGFFELVEDHFETLEPYKWDLEEELWRTDRNNAARFFAKFGLLIQLWEGDPAPERKLEGEIYKIDDGTVGNTRLKAGSTIILRYYGSALAEEDSSVEEALDAEVAAPDVSTPKCQLTPLNASDYNYEPLGEEALTPSGMSLQILDIKLTPSDRPTRLRVEYVMTNRTNQIVSEGLMKLFFADGSAVLQYGHFGGLGPGQQKTRAYQFDWTSYGNCADEVLFLQYEYDLSKMIAYEVSPQATKWKIPSSQSKIDSELRNVSVPKASSGTSQPPDSPTPTPTPSPTQTSTPTPAPSAPSYTYQALNSQVVAADGMSVTVTELYLTPKSGSTQLTVVYSMTNNIPDQEITEGSFALFFDDGSKVNQYGFFNNLFPGDSSNRRYVFEWTGSKKALLIEYEADFFASKPTQAGLKWKAPQ